MTHQYVSRKIPTKFRGEAVRCGRAAFANQAPLGLKSSDRMNNERVH